MRFDDARRLEALADYRVLDSPPERGFDLITELASRIFHTPIALVTLVDEHRQWFKSRVGLEVSETPREYSFCDHAVRAGSTLVVEDATRDPRFSANPLVLASPHIRFYFGVPLRSPEGHALGTLCVIDREARTISESQRGVLEALARLAETELEVRRRVVLLEEALEAQRQRQGAKELLASMLVHDLRGPMTSISLLAASLVTEDPQSRRDIEEMQLEVLRARRMLTDVLDLCLGQLGELRLRLASVALHDLVEAVARRFAARAASRGQRVDVELPGTPVVQEVDPDLIDRVLDNLLANALEHGPSDRPVTVALRHSSGRGLRLEVRDEGTPVATEVRDSIFRPFESHAPGPGAAARHYGLGLAFCRLAVSAHGGSIGVEPGATRGNCFFVELPAKG